MSTHVVIRLVDGCEVFGKIDPEAEASKLLIVEDPMITEEIYSEDGSVSSMLVRLSNATDENIVALCTQHIVTISIMSDAFVSYYDASVKMSIQTHQRFEAKITKVAEHMHFILYSHDEHEPLSIVSADTNSIH